jgi:hypothetical protein
MPPTMTAKDNMLKWLLNNANASASSKNQHEHKDTTTLKSAASSSSAGETYADTADDRIIANVPVLPSRQDRTLLLRAVMAAADRIERDRTETAASRGGCENSATSSAPTATAAAAAAGPGWLQTQSSHHKNLSRQEKYRQRFKMVLQEELVPAAAFSLLLCDQNNPDQLVCVLANASLLDPNVYKMQDSFECIVLLLANIVLFYGETYNGYDARVRHVIKTACIDVLFQLLLQQLETTSDPSFFDEFETVGVIFESPAVASATAAVAASAQPQAAPVQPQSSSNGNSNASRNTRGKPPMNHSNMSTISDDGTDDYSVSVSVGLDNKVDRRQQHLRFLATRKFQAIERAIAEKIAMILLLTSSDEQQTSASVAVSVATSDEHPVAAASDEHPVAAASDEHPVAAASDEQTLVAATPFENMQIKMFNRKMLIRGLQITTVGALAGTIFALTGGLAAPAIAAWIGGIGLASGTTASAVMAVATTTHVVAAIFGAGGGGLAAYKMKKRTDGLTEFRLRREKHVQRGASQEESMLPQLHTCICVSGWLNDKSDFQRPWGIQPTDPPGENKVDLLKRFYTVYDPDQLGSFKEELKLRKKQEKGDFCWDVVFKEIEEKYGRNPNHLLPLDSTPREIEERSITKDQEAVINELLGRVVLTKHYVGNLDKIQEKQAKGPEETETETPKSGEDDDQQQIVSFTVDESSKTDTRQLDEIDTSSLGSCSQFTDDPKTTTPLDGISAQESVGSNDITPGAIAIGDSDSMIQADNDHASTSASTQTQTPATESKEADETIVVWDWNSLMGGDLHTLTWESDVLLRLCSIVTTMATEVTAQATKTALGATALGAIFAAVAIPSALLTASQLIDDPYQIVILRADAAGKELAKCLLLSDERRPVTLIGYSFGARVIISCLTELARYQEIWEMKHLMTELEWKYYKEANASNSSNDDLLEFAREPASIVADVICMGLPHVVDVQALSICRQVTGGRFVNCFNRNDWFLSLTFMCRAGAKICGTHPIEDVQDVENYNVTSLVKAHSTYGDSVPKILQLVGPCQSQSNDGGWEARPC